MLNLLIGIMVGTFLGMGMTIGCLLYRKLKVRVAKDAWIDEAFDRAIEAADRFTAEV